MGVNFQQVLIREVVLLLQPLVVAAQSEVYRRKLLASVGWNLDALSELEAKVLPHLEAIAEAHDLIVERVQTPPSSLDDLMEALDTVGRTVEAVRSLSTAFEGLGAPQEALGALAESLVSSLTLGYLYLRHPLIYRLAYLLTLIETAPPPVKLGVTSRTGDLIFVPVEQSRMRLERIPDLLSDPVAALKEEYVRGRSLATKDDAQAIADALFPRLAAFLAQLGARTLYGDRPGELPRHGKLGDELAEGMLTFRFQPPIGEDGPIFGASLFLSSADRGNMGLVVIPHIGEIIEETFGEWSLVLDLSGDTLPFAVGLRGMTIPSGHGVTRVTGKSTLTKLPGSTEKAFLVGSVDGTRLEVGDFRIIGTFDLDTQRQDYGFLIEASQAAFVVAPSDGDGFLQEVLPREGLRTEFDLALGWSNTKGIYFRGGAGLEAMLAVRLSVLGLLTVDSVYLAVRARDTDIQAVVAATAGAKLGPFTAEIERVGLLAAFTFPPEGGNLGPANAELDFKPPNGIGLAVDSGVVVGGGYLFFDPENEQYAGVLQLELGETVSLKAIGLLTTRLPGGQRGFSLLAIISAEGFAPIALGFGFTLNGVGGLLGVNRTVMVDTLRAGIKNGTLGSILFPEDPVRNAPQIISDLRTVFPPAPDRYLFGPMAIIGWGAPTILTLEIGLLLELPEPVRLIVLGRLKAMLPDEERALVQVRMDAIGVVDFERGEISLDATLYDSRILQFALTGDMAMRVSLGERPNFVLAIGGFNPRFAAPPGLPRLSRLALDLAAGDNPRLRFEAYLALTSNTAQFGARVELLATAGPFSLEGLLGFDALFQFEPFQFVADLGAGVALRYEGRILMAVYLDAALSGPTPWHVRGTASFKVLFFKVAISFDARFGPQQPPEELPEPADVLGLLAAAFADARNWSGELGPGVRPLVSLRPVSDGAVTTPRVHPLAQLTVRQRVAPLNRRIEKFGNRRLEAGARAYTVATARADGGTAVAATPVQDVFALGQFQEMSDDEKLSRSSFETFDSGLRFGSDEFVYRHDPQTDVVVGYEMRTLDPQAADGAARRDEVPRAMSAAVLDAVVRSGAAGQATIRRTGTSRYRRFEPVT